MRSFFKIFFASFLALVIFSLLLFFLFLGFVTSLTKKSEPEVEAKSVLSIDLGKKFDEHARPALFAGVSGGSVPSLY